MHHSPCQRSLGNALSNGVAESSTSHYQRRLNSHPRDNATEASRGSPVGHLTDTWFMPALTQVVPMVTALIYLRHAPLCLPTKQNSASRKSTKNTHDPRTLEKLLGCKEAIILRKVESLGHWSCNRCSLHGDNRCLGVTCTRSLKSTITFMDHGDRDTRQ
jgi:hypothetical protein